MGHPEVEKRVDSEKADFQGVGMLPGHGQWEPLTLGFFWLEAEAGFTADLFK